MKLNTDQLIQQLINDVIGQLKYAEQLNIADDALLNKKPSAHSWSIAQVLEHINTYSNFYFPRITTALLSAPSSANTNFKPGWLGNYFVEMMQPDKGTIKKKYKATTKHQPAAQLNGKEVLLTYINRQKHLIKLLEQARQYNLNNISIPVSIAPFIKLKLGDVFRFIVAHQQRHTLQIQHILTAIGSLQTPGKPQVEAQHRI